MDEYGWNACEKWLFMKRGVFWTMSLVEAEQVRMVSMD